MTGSSERRTFRRPLLRTARRIREEVEEEIRFHFEMRVEELERRGLGAAEALEEARRRFGDLERTKEFCLETGLRRERHMRREEYRAELRQDVVHGLRQLRRRPGFAVVAVLTLAVGIGANTAVFSAADHVLLRPLPYASAERIVALWESQPAAGVRKVEVSPGDFLEWRERQGSFDRMGLVEPYGFDLTGDGPAVSVNAWRASAGYFETLGVRPLLGRLFLPEEYLENAEPVILVSYRLWQQRYGSDPLLVGRTIGVDGVPTTVVGVLPSNLQYPEYRDVWAPKVWRDEERSDRASTYMTAIARLRPGVDIGQAQADMDRVAASLADEYPLTNQDRRVRVIALREQILGRVRPALLVLVAAVGFLLFIACANVANLFLVRNLEREHELGVRAALGAGRGRLVRQLLTESALLAAVGGVVGLVLAQIGVAALTAFSPPDLPRAQTIAIDGRVLGFALLITALTVLLFGVAPSVRLTRTDLRSTFAASARSVTTSRGRIRMGGLLVVGEVALALILLIGAGLLVRSFFDLLSSDPGFETANRASLQVFLWDRNPSKEQRFQRASQIERRLVSTPGVTGVGIVTSLPFHPSRIDAQGTLVVEGRPDLVGGAPSIVYTTVASPDYFALMGIPLLRGRPFSREDRLDAPPVALISESLARRFFRGSDPLGQRVTVEVMGPPITREIVGVVGDVRPTTLDSDPQPELFIPFAQSGTGSLTFVVRTRAEAADVLPALREQIYQIDPGQSLYHSGTLDDLVSATLVERRFHLVMLVAFSGAALVLATIGIYGLVSFATKQRTQEIGVRIAIGAGRSDVVSLVVRQALLLALPGVALGIAGALVLTRFMEQMLYAVSPTHPATFTQLAAFMLGVSVIAALIPASRATRVDPMQILRSE